MNIQLDIDTETLEVCTSIPSEFAKNHEIIWLIDKTIGVAVKEVLPKLQKEIRKVILKDVKSE